MTVDTRPSTAVLSLQFPQSDIGRGMYVERQDPPWRVVRAFNSPNQYTLVHLHNLSGGILGGDRFALLAQIGQGRRVTLTSTGASRIYRHRVALDTAYTYIRLNVAADALLEYLPDQIIPFADSEYFQETEITLCSRNSGLFWWEIVSSGRSASGETFRYRSLRMASTISCDDEPIAIDQYTFEPAKRSMHSVGCLGRFECTATFFICKSGMEKQSWIALSKLLESEVEEMSCPDMQWGVSRLAKHGIVLRGLGMYANELQRALFHFWNLAKLYLYGVPAQMPRKVY